MASQEWFVTRKCITNIWNDKYDCLLPIADACWDFLSFVSIQLHLQKPCEGCQEVNFPPILTWLWNIWCFASLINCWLVHLHSSFQVYDLYFMKQSGVCPNFCKGKGAWPILSVTSCFWPLPITQYFHKYHTLGAFCHKTSRKTNIFMGDVRQRIMSWLTRGTGSEWSMWVKWWR